MFTEHKPFQPVHHSENPLPRELKNTHESAAPSFEHKENTNPSLYDIESVGQTLLYSEKIDTETLSPEAQIILKQSISIDDLSQSIFKAIDNFQEYIPPFFLSFEVEALFHYSIGEDPNSPQLSTEYMAVRKRFMQNLIHCIQEKSRDPKQKETLQQFIMNAEELFINASPNFLDYIGDYKDSLEIASELRSVPELANTYQHLISGLVYDLEFQHDSEQLKQFFEQWVDTAPPEQQFHIIRTLTEIGKRATAEGYTENIFPLLITILRRDIPQSALTTIIAKYSAKELSQHGYDSDTTEKQLQHRQRQLVLSTYIHPPLPVKGLTDHIAKNTVGFRDAYGQIDTITTLSEENIQSIESLATQLNLSEINTVRRIGLAQASDLLYPQNKHQHIQIPNEALQNFQSQLPNITQQHLSLLQELHQPKVRDIIESYFDIKLTDISLQAQAWLLKYLAESNTENVSRFMQVSKQQNSSQEKSILLESFLSIGQGGQEMGEKILTIAEQIPQDIASAVFAKYVDIADNATQAEQYILAHFNTKFEASDDISSIAREVSEKMLIKGKDLLMDFANHHSDDAVQLLVKLETIKTENEILKASIQTLVKEKHISTLEDIKKFTFSIEKTESLSSQDKARMMHLYDQNYSLDKGYSKEFRDLIFHGLDESFDKEGIRFYTLKKENDLVAFIRFEDHPSTDDKKHVYIGSFNVSPELADSSIGNVMFQECLQKETDENTVFEAYTDATLPISAYYINQPFVATDIVDLADRKFFAITLDASINTKLLTKQKPATLSQAQALAENGSPREDIIVQQTIFQDMPTIASQALKQGFLLTQLVQDKAISKDNVIALFEKQRS